MNSLCRRYQLNRCQAPSGSSRKAALGFTLASDLRDDVDARGFSEGDPVRPLTDPRAT
jgi:hypothetical protein